MSSQFCRQIYSARFIFIIQKLTTNVRSSVGSKSLQFKFNTTVNDAHVDITVCGYTQNALPGTSGALVLGKTEYS